MSLLPDPPAPKLPPRHALRIPPALAVALADARALDRDLEALRDRVAALTAASGDALGNTRAA